ncbi:MAG: valine--tRNA ligase [Candidatus Omnitrophota bacterium]
MEIPSRYGPKEIEPKILQKWLEKGFFQAQTKPGKKPFSIVMPPPNITGILHMGHALNNTIQDVLIRYQRMRGKEALWMPGTDHAGIAAQNVVEKNLAKKGLRKEDIGREEFLKNLWNWREEYGSAIIEQLKRLGASCDWERTRFTMDKAYSEAVKEVFIQLWNEKLIYRGNYIINWCPRCQTALADEEAPHQEKEGFLYYIKYPVKDTDEFITVATTRPETMLGDTAVAVHPEDKRFKTFWDKSIILPLTEREIKIIKDELVDIEFGTGAVKVTPAHDSNDFEIGQRHKLESILVMNPNGTMNENAGDYKEMDRFKAREAIVKALEEKGLIEKIEPYSRNIGHCYRCNTIVEPYLSRQWFVKMKPLAKQAIEAVEKGEIKFYPERWTKVYLNWMRDIHDWCISRQIWWGHRLPVYYCKSCIENTGSKSQTPNSKFQTQNSEQRGVIVAKTAPEKCPACGSGDIYQDKDVLDTWFSSWLWPFASFGWPVGEMRDEGRGMRDEGLGIRDEGKQKVREELEYFYPTDVLVTAPEIIFFWVARMIMAGFKFMGEKPFSNVCIHGTVRDSTGKKMSKSLGNVINPLEIIDKFGADALRFSLILLSSGGGSGVYISDDKFLVGRNFCNKIWNAFRFILLKVKENNLEIDTLEFKELGEVDKWVLDELDSTIKQVSSFLDNYALNEASKKIYDFFRHTFCDWYIEIIKDNFDISKAKISIYIFLNSIKLLHPFVPFITEEIFNLIKSQTALALEETLARTPWPLKSSFETQAEEPKEIPILIETIKEIRNIKSNLGIGQKKINLEIRLKKTQYERLWQVNRAWIQRLALVQDIVIKEDLERVLYENSLWALNLGIETLDIGNFLSALDKKIAKLNIVLDTCLKRLKNEKFIQNASKDIIETEKNKFDEIALQAENLRGLKNAFSSGK